MDPRRGEVEEEEEGEDRREDLEEARPRSEEDHLEVGEEVRRPSEEADGRSR